MYIYLFCCGVIILILLNILFCQRRSTGLPAIDLITFWSVHDDVGVKCAVLCAAQPTQKQYKWGAVHAVWCTTLILNK